MYKKILSLFLVLSLVYSFILPIGNVLASNVNLNVKSGTTTFTNNGTYTLNVGDKILISANSNVEYIKYKIGTGEIVTVNGTSATITVPNNLSYFTLQVYVPGMDAWTMYNIYVDYGNTVVSGVTVKSGTTTFINNETYTLSVGDKILISANSNVEYIKYKIGTGEIVTVNGTSATITVPSYLSSFSLQVFAPGMDAWTMYNINVNESNYNSTKITVKSGTTTFVDRGTYTLNIGDKIYINGTSDINNIKYKIGTGEVVTTNENSVTLTVPNYFSTYSLQVYDPSKIAWNYYTINVNGGGQQLEGKLEVKSESTTFTKNGTYTLNIGDKIYVTGPSNAEYIKYKIGTGEVVTVNGNSTTLTVPSNLSEYSLQVFTKSGDTMLGWDQYNIKVNGGQQTVEKPTIEVKSGETTLKNGGTYHLNVGDKINISATPAIEYIKYKIGTVEVVTVNSDKVELTVPDNLAQYSLQVFARGKGGTTEWEIYDIVVASQENTKYPVLLQGDERINTNVDGIAISLRTIPLVEKAGNQNFFGLNENIQYNIDFVNAGSDISGKVYIYFTIPNGATVKFVDTKGGVQTSENTIRWEFNGLAKGERGTIPVILKYTSISSNGMEIRPNAKIETNNGSDKSTVINYIYKDSSTVVTTNHEAFMIGDAGTDTFRPLEGVNRAEVAMILTRIFNIPLITDYTVTYKDYDVMQEGKYKWAEQAIMTVTKYGLMEGYDDGEFKPGAKVTKAQLITILSRKIEIDNGEGFKIKAQPIKVFNNLSQVMSSYGYTDHWASKYVAQMMRLNMVPDLKNTSDGNLDVIMTRAEVAKFISIMLLRGPSVDGTTNKELTRTFVDVNESTQNYQYILEASAKTHNSKYSGNGVETMVK